MKDTTIFSIVACLVMLSAYITCTRIEPTTQTIGDVTITTIVPIPSWLATLYSSSVLGSVVATILGGLIGIMGLALLVGIGLAYRKIRYGKWLG